MDIKKLVLNNLLCESWLGGPAPTSLWEVEGVSTSHLRVSAETKTECELLFEDSGTWNLGGILALHLRKEGGKDGKWKGFYIFLSIYYVPAVMSSPLRYTYFGITILELTSGFTIEAHGGDKTCTDTQVRSDGVLGPTDCFFFIYTYFPDQLLLYVVSE